MSQPQTKNRYTIQNILNNADVKKTIWAAGALMGIYCIGLLWWTNAMGDLATAQWTFTTWSIFIGVPLLGCWAIYVSLHLCQASRPWFLILPVLTTALVFPLTFQPWNPRVKLVSKLETLVGKTTREAQAAMKDFVRGQKSKIEPQYVPENLQDKGITHSIYYRWNDDPYNADVGIAYLVNDKVVGVEFSPD